KISLKIQSHHPTQQMYLIERTIPNPSVVREDSGRISNLLAENILPRIEVYGQHEISELAKNSEKRTRLLDRFVDTDEALNRRKSELLRDLEKSRQSILNLRYELHDVEERLAALPGLEETLERFRAAGLEERLRERSVLVREEQVLLSIPERLEPFNQSLENIQSELPIDLTFLSQKALEDLPGKEILISANKVLEQLSRDLEDVVIRYKNALQRANEEIIQIRSRWEERKLEVQKEYEKILRELKKSAIDGEEFIRLRRNIESLRPLRERQKQLLQQKNDLLERRRMYLTEWEDLKAEEFRNLDRAANKVNRKLRQRVDVTVTFSGDRKSLFKLLRERVGGQLSETIEKLEGKETISLTDFADTCREGTERLREKYGFTPMQARNIAEANPEVFMCIEELDLSPTTTIRLNTASVDEPPAWQTLEDLSTGQKATAILLLLLLDSDAPLIVDQPEDDLDNRFITEGVVPRIRAEKRLRQFVFSTHNANIPVLGDAELILGLTASGEADGGTTKIPGKHRGSIDEQSVRELVEEVLEGGKMAFETRRLKYGF
ncbi:MAG: phosphoesterase, partial [Gammaproteobacteria bacterium]|nr:phosphoesterase [Gammaproteobacteria bacterium]